MTLRELLGFKPRMKDLAAQMLTQFARGGTGGWYFDAEQGMLRNGEQGTINLANIYLEYAQTARSKRGVLLQKYAAMGRIAALETPKLWAVAAKSIYPVLRSSFDLTVLAIEARAQSSEMINVVSWPWLGDLHIRLVYDFGMQLAMVNRETLNTWGQTDEAVRIRAMQNLSALDSPSWEALRGGAYRLHSEVSYEESLLLLDKVIDLLPFNSFAVCIAANRGILLAADSRSEPAMIALIAEATRCLQEKPWPMSATLCTRIDGQWQEYHATGAAAKPAGDLVRFNLSISYDGQSAALERLYEKTGVDIHVANFAMMRVASEDNAVRSWCSWSEGVYATLPKTDIVVLGRDDTHGPRDAILVDWTHVETWCAQHLRETEEDPPRFIVDSFPDEAQFAALKAVGRSFTI
jgi:hypothetical protein